MKFEKDLPSNPSFEYLRREARTIKARHRCQEPTVAALIGHFDTSFHGNSATAIFASNFSILDAQRVVARRFGFTSWAKLKKYVLVSAADAPVQNPQLRDVLLKQQREVRALVALIDSQCGEEKAASIEMLNQFGSETHQLMDSVFSQYGWPGPAIVGRDGADACWHLVVSATLESELQFKAAQLMKQAFSTGDARGPQYVSIVDRCLELSFLPTVYGTIFQIDESLQFNAEEAVVDPVSLDKRRASVGLAPHKHFYNILLERGREEGWLEKVNTEQNLRHKRSVSEKGGYITVAQNYSEFIATLA